MTWSGKGKRTIFNYMTNWRIYLVPLACISLALLGLHSTSADVTSQAKLPSLADRIARLESEMPPAGTVIAYAGQWPIPKSRSIEGEPIETFASSDWRHCDGAYLSVNDYPTLFNSIGFTYGRDPANKFRLPNLTGQFLRGVDDTERTSANSIGEKAKGVGTSQAHGTAKPNGLVARVDMGDIKGVKVDGTNTHGQVDNSGGDEFNLNETAPKSLRCEVTFTGWDNETRPQNVAVYWLIKVR